MRVEESIVVDAPPEEVWEAIADPDRYGEFMRGITRWEVQGRRRRGLGARYRINMAVGSAQVGGLIEVVEYDAPCDMAWTSVLGADHRGRWRLRDTDDGRTRVTFRLSYQAPGAILGAIADRVAAPMVRNNMRQSLRELAALFDGTGLTRAEMGEHVGVMGAVTQRLWAAQVLAKAGFLRPHRPDRLVRVVATLQRWGPTPAAGYRSSALLYPDEDAIIDELGHLTFREVHERSSAIANALADAGVNEGDNVGLMCRNHRYFIESVVALSKLGANALLLNTAFAAPQLTDVVQREKPVALIFDEEFYELLEDAGRRRKRFVAWQDSDDVPDPTLESLIERGDTSDPLPPAEKGRVVILTSGTTGTPKGASRKQPDSVEPAAALLSKIPLRAREKWLIAAPLFHTWGFAHFTLGMLLSSTVVLQRKFDPEGTLSGVAQHQVTSCPMVPVMVQRIMELPEETRKKYDTSSLRTIPLSGSALPGGLSERFMDEFGEILYNLYGSTEVAWATIATPQDLRVAPGTAGRAPRGTIVKIFDDEGRELPTGETGRIFVGNEMLFEGYTGGGNKDMIDGLMSSGDVGHLDDAGRLFIEGRDDEMIVSGGENVFPAEVEDLLARHDKVAEVAVIGVHDEKFGQRLKAFVVTREGAKLSDDEVKSYVKDNLARYKVPREVEFLGELPRNATGKVLKRVLKEDEEGDGDGASASRSSSKRSSRSSSKRSSSNGGSRSRSKKR